MTERADTTHKFRFRQYADKLLGDMQQSYSDGTIEHQLDKYQQRLDRLMIGYRKDESLGRLRYKLFEAQAYLHYLKGDSNKALSSIREAVKIRGEHFDDSVELQKLIMTNRGRMSIAHSHVERSRGVQQRWRLLARKTPKALGLAHVQLLRVCLAAVFILVAAGTYWLAVRPHFIREECSKVASAGSQQGNGSIIYLSDLNNDNYSNLYQQCLNQRGL